MGPLGPLGPPSAHLAPLRGWDFQVLLLGGGVPCRGMCFRLEMHFWAPQGAGISKSSC